MSARLDTYADADYFRVRMDSANMLEKESEIIFSDSFFFLH